MGDHTICLEMDFVVVGGGLTGVCAALAAARHGMRVALCHDRSVLGGNSSSECRVWICGATGMGFNRYADETGIIAELTQENLYRTCGTRCCWTRSGRKRTSPCCSRRA